jgi:hypothetical protein
MMEGPLHFVAIFLLLYILPFPPALGESSLLAKKMARTLKIPTHKKNKIKAWSWSTIALILFGIVLIGSFLVPGGDYVSKSKSKSKSKSNKSGKKNVLSMDLNKTIERSAKAIKAKDFDRAAKLATRIVSEFPDSWIGWLNLGIAKRFGNRK